MHDCYYEFLSLLSLQFVYHCIKKQYIMFRKHHQGKYPVQIFSHHQTGLNSHFFGQYGILGTIDFISTL